MKKIFLLAALATIIYSCSKEESIDSTDPNGGPNNSTSLLVKTVLKAGTDSAVNNYTYDSQKRLIGQAFTGNSNFFGENSQTTIIRNAQGIIERIMMVDEDGEQIEYRVFYDAVGKKYIGKSASIDYMGMTIKDSTAYTYNSNGQITQEIYFFNTGTGYYDYGKSEYLYTASNISTEKSYFKDSTNNYKHVATLAYEYDTKTAALNLGMEGIILEQGTSVSANNLTKVTYTDLQDPSENQTFSFNYTYNSANRPASGNFIFNNLPIPMTFYYK